MELNIVGQISRKNKNFPYDATHVHIVNENIQLFYRIVSIKYSDGDIKEVLQYKSFSGMWYNTSIRDYKLKELTFKEIVD